MIHVDSRTDGRENIPERGRDVTVVPNTLAGFHRSERRLLRLPVPDISSVPLWRDPRIPINQVKNR